MGKVQKILKIEFARCLNKKKKTLRSKKKVTVPSLIFYSKVQGFGRAQRSVEVEPFQKKRKNGASLYGE